MPFHLVPGSAICCKTHSHRHGWNGDICQDPAAWECTARQDFREDFCARNDDRCFHLRTFAEHDPGLIIEETGGRWIFKDDITVFDDQILITWGSPFFEPRGARMGRSVVFGGYRVRRVVPIELPFRTNYRVEPYADCWFRVANLNVRAPFFRDTGGKYVKQLNRDGVWRLFEQFEDAAARPESWHDPADRDRLEAFREGLDGWLDAAAEKAERFADPRSAAASTSGPPESGNSVFSAPIGRLPEEPKKHTAEPVSSPEERIPSPVPPRIRPELIEPGQMDWIRQTYGISTLQALRTASLTKPLVILRGDPGVGKSHLAVRVLDDAERERTCIIPVSATWRGREDLLGYVNPVNGWFEATEFTRFLVKAEQAWNNGDRRPWLVIFEEFNLSQPEHWLADVLAVSQFQEPVDRRISFGGKGIEDLGGQDSVILSTSVCFLATVNTDHTTRPLSPRVLDRSAIVSLTLDPREALQMAEVALEDDQVRAVETLHALIHRKGAAFSVRTAKSLRACLDMRESLGLDEWGVLDLVLAQEVLSKVRLLARDPVDEELMELLNDWSQEEGSCLTRCPLMIEQWKELLATGQDVIQA